MNTIQTLLKLTAVPLFCCLAFVPTLAQEDDDPLAGVKCIVIGKRGANVEKYAEHLGCKVYFCCDGCVTKFNESKDKFTTKANHQLVLTGQFVQKHCPFSGGEINADHKAQVAGTEIGFCCGKCKAKVQETEDLAAKAELVFSASAFEKGFEKAIDLSDAVCPIGGGPASADFSAKHLDGTVYFCCGGCADSFAKDSSEYVAAANYQLTVTGQYVQKGCPFSGREVIEDAITEVGATKVGFCCKGCCGKVADTAEVKDQIKMVFNKETFEKGFAVKEKGK